MKGMTLVAKTITRLTLGLILLFGFYIFMHGHVSHGVGFAGGVIIALGFIHLMLAYGKTVALKKVGEKYVYFLKNGGMLALLAVSVTGMFLGKGFLGNFLGTGRPFELYSAGIIAVTNTIVCLTVSGCLFLLFITFINFKSKR
jgi:multicomponent Na+:H+ antiporter subunit B